MSIFLIPKATCQLLFIRRGPNPGGKHGWENIELFSDRRFAVWLDEFKRIKDRHADRGLICAIMEE